MRKNSSYIFILAIIVAFVSCVPMSQFKETDQKKSEFSQERDKLKIQNERLVVDTTEMGAELRSLRSTYSELLEDTFQLGKSVRRLEDLYQGALDMNNELSASKEALAKGSAAEANKLLSELQAAQADLLKREDELSLLAQKLNAKKKNLEELQAELEANNRILEEKNAELEERNKRLIELENMLSKKDSAVNALKDKVAAALYQFEQDGLSVEVRNGKVYVSLEEQLLFKTGKSEIDPKGKSAIQKLAKVLEQNEDINIMIEGHTDDVPFKGKGQLIDNWDLSVKRATTIVRIITQNSTIDPKRLTASGRGEYIPVDAGKSKEARQKNRRTEIILTPKLDELFELLESN
jgi:chemotaxis protein MotB